MAVALRRVAIDILTKALTAKRESKHVEFKQTFDPSSPHDWCEIVKDVVALANSGGGVILFGVDSVGSPSGHPVKEIASIDPADVSNKIAKYTGAATPEFEVATASKEGHDLIAFIIHAASIPIVFEKPGTYSIGSGQQRAAFGVGTVYFRHGAKSEPGSSNDIRLILERQLELIRKSWIGGVRRVVQAPKGAQVVVVQPPSRGAGTGSVPAAVRVVEDPNATPVFLTRDSPKASGTFVHEVVSDGIFDEINNVIDANRALARGQEAFHLGQPVYYRIYAERKYVRQREADVAVLFRSALIEFYAPGLFWTLGLPDAAVAHTFAELFLRPKTPHVHCLLRLALLLESDFSDWLYAKWQDKWRRHPQPPSFFWTFKEMLGKAKDVDSRLAATRTGPTSEISVPGATPVRVGDLLADRQRAASLLSMACMRAFESNAAEVRSTARLLDCLAYGHDVRSRSRALSNSIIAAITEHEPETAESA